MGPTGSLLTSALRTRVAEIVEIIRQMDFSLAHCKYLVATHADVDHIQGLRKVKEMLPSAETVGHPESLRLLKEGDRIVTYAEISAQGISIDLPTLELDRTINDGDVLTLGSKEIEVWHTPGHTEGMLSFRMENLLFCADNIYRDGCVWQHRRSSRIGPALVHRVADPYS